MQDTRIPQVEAAGGIMNGSMKDWWYGYGAAPTEAILTINGYDEAFDGCKSLEDCDLGSRLEMAGYTRLRLETSTGLDVVEHGHGPVSLRALADLVVEKPKAPKCNFAIYNYNRRARRFRANIGPIPPDGLEFIKRSTRESPCSGCGGEDYDLEEGFRWWAENVPAFDLRKERATTLRALYG